MPRRPVRGFRQGSLDGLCGLYSIVNAVKAAARNAGRTHTRGSAQSWFTREDAWELFGALARSLERDRRLARSYAEGIEPATLVHLLRHATRWLERYLGRRLIARRAFFRPARPGRARIVEAMERHLVKPNTAVVMGLHGHPGHWTVATRTSPMVLRLADSDGGNWLWKHPLRGRNRASFHAGRIDPYCVFLIEIRPDEHNQVNLPLKLVLQLSGVGARRLLVSTESGPSLEYHSAKRFGCPRLERVNRMPHSVQLEKAVVAAMRYDSALHSI